MPADNTLIIVVLYDGDEDNDMHRFLSYPPYIQRIRGIINEMRDTASNGDGTCDWDGYTFDELERRMKEAGIPFFECGMEYMEW